MDRLMQTKICKACENQIFHLQRGIICGLTDNVATFEKTCSDFKPKELRLRNDEIENHYRESLNENYQQTLAAKRDISDEKKLVINGANWFYWIAGLSLINSIIVYVGGNLSFIFGLGLTQLIDGLVYTIMGKYHAIGLIPNILIQAGFVAIGYYANQLKRSAFIVGMGLYGLDSLLFLMFNDWLSFAFHVFAFVMILRGYKKIKYLEETMNSQASNTKTQVIE